MRTISTILGCVFGYMWLLLSVLVSAETIMRKVFGVSIQGADEIGGYTLAIGSSLAFCVAVIGRNHMRIDFLHYRLPEYAQAVLNWLAISSIATFAVLLSWTSFGIIVDTLAYHSTAPTPWATPLIYPQGLWYAGLTIFAVVAVVKALQGTRLLIAGRWERLNTLFNPKASKEELEEELADAAARH